MIPRIPSACQQGSRDSSSFLDRSSAPRGTALGNSMFSVENQSSSSSDGAHRDYLHIHHSSRTQDLCPVRRKYQDRARSFHDTSRSYEQPNLSNTLDSAFTPAIMNSSSSFDHPKLSPLYDTTTNPCQDPRRLPSSKILVTASKASTYSQIHSHSSSSSTGLRNRVKNGTLSSIYDEKGGRYAASPAAEPVIRKKRLSSAPPNPRSPRIRNNRHPDPLFLKNSAVREQVHCRWIRFEQLFILAFWIHFQDFCPYCHFLT